MVQLTAAACRAGRALIEWGVRDLAKNAKLSPNTVHLIERGHEPREETADKIIAAFAKHGVEITNGEGTGARLVKVKAKRKR